MTGHSRHAFVMGRVSGILTVFFAAMSASTLEAAPLSGEAKAALERIGTGTGVCVVLGLPEGDQGSLVIDVARGSELLVYFQSPEAEEVSAVRKAAEAAGLLGSRVFVDQGDFDRVHLADNLAGAVLVCSSAEKHVKEDDLLRVLHPQGKAIVGDREIVRPFPEGIDSWSHPFHGPDNNPQSTDRLARAPYLTQFLAEPLFCPMPEISVAAGGRVFRAFGHIAHKANQNAMLNQDYGEVDTLEAIDDAARKYNADRDRVTITGSSMGGAATWYLTSHNPDRFAAGAPFCGYCDYRLWEKPGGLTFHMHPWEEPSWQARSAVKLIENFEHTPLWIVHGAWDRSVGGGVSVEHSQQMSRLLERKGFSHQYTEVPATGHGCRTPEIWEKVILWLLQQKKRRSPDHVCLVTYELRHNRSYWVSIDQLERYAERAKLDARRTDDGRVAVTTENVRTLSLGPIADADSAQVTINGQDVAEGDLTRRAQFRREPDGAWRSGEFDVSRQKHHGCSGPIGDLFHESLILVPGTQGSDEETFFLGNVAGNARRYFRGRNGGVHRGGIMGENNVDLPLVPDSQLSDEDRTENNLLLYGTYSTNSVLKHFEGRLPLEFAETSISVADKKFDGEKVAVFAVFPHPENPDRYVAVHGGVTPDAITWGSHLDMQLLPDYIAYNGGELLDWGFLNNRWKAQD